MKRCLLILLALLLIIAPVIAIVDNGGFETGSLPNWTDASSGEGTTIASSNVTTESKYIGTYGCELNVTFTDDGLSEGSAAITTTLTPIDFNMISFDYKVADVNASSVGTWIEVVAFSSSLYTEGLPSTTDWVHVDMNLELLLGDGWQDLVGAEEPMEVSLVLLNPEIGDNGKKNVLVYIDNFETSTVPSMPHSSFDYSTDIGSAPLGVMFNDTSTDSPVTWAWFFRDEQYAKGWESQNVSSGWNARAGQDMAIIRPYGDLIVAGGYDGSYYNDTWFSGDNGISWVVNSTSPGWKAREGSSLVSTSNGYLILLGGYDGSSYFNDVWMSTDGGNTWAQQTASAEWSARSYQSAIIDSSDEIILTGGKNGASYNTDTWISFDYGATWTQRSASSGWSGRNGHESVILSDGSIILFGGSDGVTRYNDVWKSIDLGATWTRQTADAQWLPRTYFASVVTPVDDIVIYGGSFAGSLIGSDAWVSQDTGGNWTQILPGSWSPRQYQSAVMTFDGHVILAGGEDATGYTNDTWQTQIAGSILQNNYHLFNYVGVYNVSLQVHNSGGTSISFHEITAGEYLYPHANFNWIQSSLTDPLNVSFTDTSTNTPTGWAWYFGDEPYNQSWTLVEASAGWSPRAGMGSTVTQNGSVILVGGNLWSPSYAAANGVWVSNKIGGSWTNITSSVALPYLKLNGGAMAPLGNGRYSVFTGGYSAELGHSNATWITDDAGVTWYLMNASSGWSPRVYHALSSTSNGTLILTGGYDSITGISNSQTWASVDAGSTWKLMNPFSGWEARYYHKTVVLQDDSIVLVGGTGGAMLPYTDVWRSTNYGATWSEINASAWVNMESHGLVVLPDDSIVATGGLGTNVSWRSTDKGITWTQLSNDIPDGTQRRILGSVALPNGSILAFGGVNYGFSANNSVYSRETAGSNIQNVSHTFPGYGWYTVSLQSYGENGTSVIQKLIEVSEPHFLNLTMRDADSHEIINVSTVTDNFAHSIVTTDGTYSQKYFNTTVVVSISSVGYISVVNGYSMDEDRTATVYLTAYSPSPTQNPQQNTLWSPPQVVFQVLDNNNNPIIGTPVYANAVWTTLPGGLSGAVELFQSAFGLSNSTAATILNSTTTYAGTTDSSGSVVFMMVPVIQYNVTARDTNGANYTITIMPKDPYYQIKMLNASYENQALKQITYETNLRANVFNTSFYETPNQTIGIMGAEIYDSTGQTAGANCWWTLIDNQTTWWDNRTWALGSGLQIINKSVEIVPYQQWSWGCVTT